MVHPIKIVEIELSEPIRNLTDIKGYAGVQVFVLWHSIPIGKVNLNNTENFITAKVIEEHIFAKLGMALLRRILADGLINFRSGEEFQLQSIKGGNAPNESQLPFITVAVCTRNRPEDIKHCLEAISQIHYPKFEVVIVDNAPSNDDTKHVIENHFSHYRYIKEPRPGLDWARNRALLEAKGEIIAFTDDDVFVSRFWLNHIAEAFLQNPRIAAITGLVIPHEMETRPQIWFEMYGGFDRGYARRWFVGNKSQLPWNYLGAGQFGTGANMAFKIEVLKQTGGFDPALDVGTATNGGGDLEMYFRILKEGHLLVYEPSAFVRHRHRRTYAELKRQIENNSVGFFSYCKRSLEYYPEERKSFQKLWKWWLTRWIGKRFLKAMIGRLNVPFDLLVAEIRGTFKSMGCYKRARNRATEIQLQFPSEPVFPFMPASSATTISRIPVENKTAVRLIDINKPITAINNVSDYPKTRLFIKWNKWFLGYIEISNLFQPISKFEIIDAICESKGLVLFSEVARNHITFNDLAGIQNHIAYWNSKAENPVVNPVKAKASVVVATFDRPGDLRNCLKHLFNQQTSHPYEVIVVDNNPGSGLSKKIVSDFAGAIYIPEKRKGLSYARNAGIRNATGEIILSTDDDVTVPPDWIENAMLPFQDPEVFVVTGNVLPIELENDAQHFFELYGGLGRGYKALRVSREWFNSYRKKAVPTWSLGACANTAFRKEIFTNPAMGYFKETLGAGTPTGCSEDSYLIYKVLKSGKTVAYEPSSFVWHKHRNTRTAFEKQIYNYSKGHVAHHLYTVINDKDWRGLFRLFVELPVNYLSRFKRWILGDRKYPLSMILIELRGTIAGPFALFRSVNRVRKTAKKMTASEKYDHPVAGEEKDVKHQGLAEVPGK